MVALQQCTEQGPHSSHDWQPPPQYYHCEGIKRPECDCDLSGVYPPGIHLLDHAEIELVNGYLVERGVHEETWVDGAMAYLPYSDAELMGKITELIETAEKVCRTGQLPIRSQTKGEIILIPLQPEVIRAMAELTMALRELNRKATNGQPND